MLGVGFAYVAVISRFHLEWYSNISGKTIETKVSSPLCRDNTYSSMTIGSPRTLDFSNATANCTLSKA